LGKELITHIKPQHFNTTHLIGNFPNNIDLVKHFLHLRPKNEEPIP